MPQTLNPYAPTTSSTEPSGEIRLVDCDPQAGVVNFQAFVDEDCWRRIRVAPPPPIIHWLAGWVLTGVAVGSVCTVLLSDWYGSLRVLILSLSVLAGMFGLIFLIVCQDLRRVARSKRQTEVQPWFHGNIQGQISREHVMVHTDTVSLSIPAQVVTKLQWVSGALQVHFGQISIPPNPRRRLSIPEEAFPAGRQTVLPLDPRAKLANKELTDARFQEIIDDLIESLPVDVSKREWWLPIDNHVRWNDLEWLKERIHLRRFLRVVVLLTFGLFVVLWLRAAMLPATWQPRSDALATATMWLLLPAAMAATYLAIYHLPMIAGRSVIRLQGLVAGDRSGRNRLICLRTNGIAALYRRKPTDYAKWTEHGLEIWAEPSRMLFVIPQRVFPVNEHSTMAEVFGEVPDPPFDSPSEQHWEGPLMLPGGGIPVNPS